MGTWVRTPQPEMESGLHLVTGRLSHVSLCQNEPENGFVSKMEELRRVFFMRPGCPQFITRATSVSHVGKSHCLGLLAGGTLLLHPSTVSLLGGNGCCFGNPN
jgi:hypothetical protein